MTTPTKRIIIESFVNELSKILNEMLTKLTNNYIYIDGDPKRHTHTHIQR